jgi:putative SOS response-associated peptidase YedK
MINARAETVHEKPAFRRGFKSRRLLIPVDGFYEWFPTQQLGKSGKPLKQPFYIHPANPHDVLALAGLYEFWRDPDKADDDPGKWLTSFTIITTTATDDVGRIHDRMPMAVTPDNWDQWLDPPPRRRRHHPSPDGPAHRARDLRNLQSRQRCEEQRPRTARARTGRTSRWQWRVTARRRAAGCPGSLRDTRSDGCGETSARRSRNAE